MLLHLQHCKILFYLSRGLAAGDQSSEEGFANLGGGHDLGTFRCCRGFIGSPELFFLQLYALVLLVRVQFLVLGLLLRDERLALFPFELALLQC